MKSLRILFFLLLIAASSFGQFNMPSFKEVVTTFFSNYSFDSNESYLKFQRKKDGWYISEDLYSKPGNYFNTKLYWTESQKNYNNLEYNTTNGDTSYLSENVSKYLSQIDWAYEEYPFQRIKYYGYSGWDWDIINDLSNQSLITDTLLESQARAYVNYASGFISEQFGEIFVNNDSDRLPVKASAQISKTGIQKFIFYQQKAIDAYTNLLKLNSNYETKVGNVKIKLANEYVYSYMQLALAGDSVRAKEFALKANYPDSLLDLNKSYLTDLPSNSILITSGDNDTYPLLYLQKVKNYRTDVIVLNYSLIGFRRYLLLVNNKENQRLFSTSKEIYLKDNFDYFIYGNNNETKENKVINVNTFLQHLEADYNPFDSSIFLYKDEKLKKYYAKNLVFGGFRGNSSFEVGNYLFMNDYILLDIINTQKKTKIFFTFQVDLLSKLLKQRGSIYELVF